MDDFFEWASERTKERRAEVLEENRKQIKRTPKPPKVRCYEYSEEALARMDQRRYNKQIEMEGTLNKRQAEILTDYSNGMTFRMIMMKYQICMGTVVNQLQKIRDRLDSKNNVHSVKIALQKGLIT